MTSRHTHVERASLRSLTNWNNSAWMISRGAIVSSRRALVKRAVRHLLHEGGEVSVSLTEYDNQIIDPSVFIALERRRLSLSALADAIPDEPIVLSSMTASELIIGVHRADSPKRRSRREAFVEAILQAIPVVPFDLRAARTHARLFAELASVGQPIGAHDLIIAATAIANDFPVLTDNLRHFDRVPGLSVRQPRW